MAALPLVGCNPYEKAEAGDAQSFITRIEARKRAAYAYLKGRSRHWVKEHNWSIVSDRKLGDSRDFVCISCYIEAMNEPGKLGAWVCTGHVTDDFMKMASDLADAVEENVPDLWWFDIPFKSSRAT